MNLLINCKKADVGQPSDPVTHVANARFADTSMAIEAGAHLLDCVFERCSFSGDLSCLYTDDVKFDRCIFYGVTLSNCDFIGAEFVNCEFYNCSGAGCVTCQPGLEDLFDYIDPGQPETEPEPDFIQMDLMYDMHREREVVSGARYATAI